MATQSHLARGKWNLPLVICVWWQHSLTLLEMNKIHHLLSVSMATQSHLARGKWNLPLVICVWWQHSLTLQTHALLQLQGQSQKKNVTSVQLQRRLQDVKLEQKHLINKEHRKSLCLSVNLNAMNDLAFDPLNLSRWNLMRSSFWTRGLYAGYTVYSLANTITITSQCAFSKLIRPWLISHKKRYTHWQKKTGSLIINNNNKEDFYSAHLPHTVGPQGVLQ